MRRLGLGLSVQGLCVLANGTYAAESIQTPTMPSSMWRAYSKPSQSLLKPHAFSPRENCDFECWLQVSEGAIDLDLLRHQLLQHLLIAAAIGLCDLRAQFALAAFKATVFQSVQRAFHLQWIRCSRILVQRYRPTVIRCRI